MAGTAELQPTLTTDTYMFVDSIPEIAQARLQERTRAELLLAGRRSQANSGSAEIDLPLPVDALSTANKVLAAAGKFGTDSPEHSELYEGLVLDCQRLVGEWYRKKKPEYFSPIRHTFDAETQDFYSHGLSIRQMTENALTPIGDNPEEEARRINERVEDATPNILRKLGCIAMGTDTIRTISECTDKALNDYKSDMKARRVHRGYRGYVPEIEKAMIRDIRLDPVTGDRYEEQLAVSGIYINHEIILKTLERRGVDAGDIDKTKLHGSQLLVTDGLLDFMRELDRTASEEWCVNIFMGEVVPKGFVKNYETFRGQALQRQTELTELAETVTTFILNLADENYDPRRAPARVEAFVKKKLLKIAKTDTSVAIQMFDRDTAIGLRQVAYLESIGQYGQAFEEMDRVEEMAPGGGFCGAGSCGLESVDIMSDSGRNLAKKLNASSGDTILKDTERSCKCGSKTIVYAFNKKKVNKYCESCGSSESKVTSSGV